MEKKDTQAPGPLLKDANYDPESNDLRNVLSQCHLKLSDFSINDMQNCSLLPLRLPIVCFFCKCYFLNPCFQVLQDVLCINEIMHVISSSIWN